MACACKTCTQCSPAPRTYDGEWNPGDGALRCRIVNLLSSFAKVSALAALFGLSGACGPSLDLPPPPDVNAEERIALFRAPDAVVLPDIMADVADSIAEIHWEVERSSFYEEILDLVVDVQDEIYDENGNVNLGGTTFGSPNGGVTVDYICEGWEDPAPAEPEPANGSMTLTMRLTAGQIAPLMWGTLDDCKYPLQLGPLRADALYRGSIVMYFEEPVSATTNVYASPVTFITQGTIVVDGNEFPIEELFRVTLLFDEEGNRIVGAFRLDILVELADGTAFVYSFDTQLGQQLIDATGTLRCNLEDRECAGNSGTFSW